MGELAAPAADSSLETGSTANDNAIDACRHHWLHATPEDCGRTTCSLPRPAEAAEVASTPTPTTPCDFSDGKEAGGTAPTTQRQQTRHSAYVRSELERLLRQQGYPDRPDFLRSFEAFSGGAEEHPWRSWVCSVSNRELELEAIEEAIEEHRADIEAIEEAREEALAGM